MIWHQFLTIFFLLKLPSFIGKMQVSISLGLYSFVKDLAVFLINWQFFIYHFIKVRDSKLIKDTVFDLVWPSKVTPLVKQHLEAGERGKSVFHFILFYLHGSNLWLCCFSIERGKKSGSYFFFPLDNYFCEEEVIIQNYITVSPQFRRFLWRIWLLSSSLWKHLRRPSTGSFLLTTVVILPLYPLSMTSLLWAIVTYSREPRGSGRTMVMPSISSPLPACQRLDRTGNYTANLCLPMQTPYEKVQPRSCILWFSCWANSEFIKITLTW